MPTSGDGEAVNLTDDPAEYDDLEWSPDGELIAFTVSGGGLYTVPADPSVQQPDQTQLVAGDIGSPTWSPDGTWIAYDMDSVAAGFDGQIWRMELANTSNKVRLDDTSDGLDDADPVWSPDGQRILYTSYRGTHQYSADVHTMRASDGGDDQVVVATDDPEHAGSWQWSNHPRCTIYGSRRDDSLAGTSSDDVLCGFGGEDELRGWGGNDFLVGGDGDDLLVGGDGDDMLDGGFGMDTAAFGAGPVTASLRLGIANGDGADQLSGIEHVFGSPEGDILKGSRTPNTIQGNGGDDSLFGLGGDDILRGGGGNDSLDGGKGTDECEQGKGTGEVTACEL
jgi:Ca2+-binding RTX toxin-like protein